MAYEMLSGQPAFRGDDETAILFQVVHQAPPPLVLAHPATPARRDSLAAVVGRALEKDRSRRYPSILAFSAALENASGIVRDSGRRARAIMDSREGVATAPAGGPEADAPTRFDPRPPVNSSSLPTGSPLPARKRLPRWPAVILASLVAGGAAAALLGPRWRAPGSEVAATSMAGPPATVSAPLAQRPAAPEPVTIEIEGLPAGALVQWDGRTTVPPIALERDPRPHHLKVEAAGFLPYEAEIVADRNRTLVLSLQPARGRRAPARLTTQR
jgi:serine/threonine-protein kinase